MLCETHRRTKEERQKSGHRFHAAHYRAIILVVRTHQRVVALLRAVEQAWNAGDAVAYARLFAADAVYVTRSGAIWRGRPAIEEGHAAALAGPLADSELRLRPAHILVPALSVAIAHVDVELSSETSISRAVTTFVLGLNGTEWSILAAHTSEVAAVHYSIELTKPLERSTPLERLGNIGVPDLCGV